MLTLTIVSPVMWNVIILFPKVMLTLTIVQYMIILFLLFLLQFALACACLAVNAEQKDALAEQGWRMASNETRSDVQRQFNCCGFKDPNLAFNETLGHPPCITVSHPPCVTVSHPPCMHYCKCKSSTMHYSESPTMYALL